MINGIYDLKAIEFPENQNEHKLQKLTLNLILFDLFFLFLDERA